MNTTIPRSHKKRVAAVKDRTQKCLVYNLENGFTGTEGNLEWVWDQFLNHNRGKLVDHGDKGFWIEIHDNLWYELS